MRIFLPAAGGLDAEGLLALLGTHAIPGLERHDAEAGTHTVSVPAASGPVAVTLRPEAAGVHAEWDAGESPGPRSGTDRDGGDSLGPRAGAARDPGTAHGQRPGTNRDAGDGHGHRADGTRAAVAVTVSRWLDLDRDPAAANEALARDPLLAPLVAARPGLRVPGALNHFAAAANTVLGQQVSLAAMRTFVGRLVCAYGRPGPGGLLLFPEAATLAGADPQELRAAVGIPSARARTLLAVAEAFAGCGLPHLAPAPFPLERGDLLALPGVGPWTADYLAVRAMGDPDAFPAGDLVLRRALGGVDPRTAEARAEVWRPHRARAVVYLWTASAYLPVSPQSTRRRAPARPPEPGPRPARR